jgi:hypothetical protein
MPTFITKKDVEFFRKKNMEFYKLFMFPVKVYKLKKTEHNHIYNEDANKKFEDPYEIEAYIPDLPKWQNEMTKFGMDEIRNLRAYFSIDLLKQEGREFPHAGDQLVIQEDTYLVTQSNPIDYGSNIQIPLSHVIELKRLRYERPDQGTTVFKDY